MSLKRNEIEREEKWESFFKSMDYIELRQGYAFRVIPAAGGAMLRFRILHIESKNEYSIYFDTNNALGYMTEPYYEVHPIDGDCYRSFDINQIIVRIYIEEEGEEIIKKDFPEFFI